MLNDTLLQGKAIVDGCRDCLSVARIDDDCCRPATGEGRQNRGLAYEYGGHLELLEHELCELEPRIFIVD